MTEPREDWQAIATRALTTLDAIRAYVEPYHLAAITPTSGDVVPDDYQRGLIHGLDHVYQLATADPQGADPDFVAAQDWDAAEDDPPGPSLDPGETSDGYHTFNELYEHRVALFAALCRSWPDLSWRSLHHHDGTSFGGFFIAGMTLPDGTVTYHCKMSTWGDFDGVAIREAAPEWDGHTPADVVTRLNAWAPE